MDEQIYELLRNSYCCKVEKVGRMESTILVERKKKIGIKKKILGIFPIYEYERWNETVSGWTYADLNLRNNFTGRITGSCRIAICYDSVGKTVYWRYA